MKLKDYKMKATVRQFLDNHFAMEMDIDYKDNEDYNFENYNGYIDFELKDGALKEIRAFEYDCEYDDEDEEVEISWSIDFDYKYDKENYQLDKKEYL